MDFFCSVDTDTTKICVRAQLWFSSTLLFCYYNVFPFFTSLFTRGYKIDQRSLILFSINIIQQCERQLFRLLHRELIQKERRRFQTLLRSSKFHHCPLKSPKPGPIASHELYETHHATDEKFSPSFGTIKTNILRGVGSCTGVGVNYTSKWNRGIRPRRSTLNLVAIVLTVLPLYRTESLPSLQTAPTSTELGQ